MGIVVQFGGAQSVRVEGYRMDFSVIGDGRKYCHDSVVQSVSFNDDRSAWYEVQQYWSGGESGLKPVECIPTFLGEVPSDIFLS